MSFARHLSSFLFRLAGWKTGQLLDLSMDRCVMIAAPHTSNWDLYYTRLAFWIMGIPVRFTIKEEWMRPPIGWLIRALGGIGINRKPKVPGESRKSMVEAMADLFQTHPRLVILITPEGTRAKRTEWKTGFYHLAKMASVPIACGYLDYGKREAGVGPIVYPSQDMMADFRIIMDFYKTKTAKYPELFSVHEAAYRD